MSTYQIAKGWDNTAGLADIADETLKIYPPRNPITSPARVLTAVDGTAVADGAKTAALVFDDYLTTERMHSLLVQFGLRTGYAELESAKVTVRIPGVGRDWKTWNAIIYHPHAEYILSRFRDVSFRLALIKRVGAGEFTSEFTSEFT